MSPPESSSRRPYTGSCHCGHTKYIAFLTFPIVPGCAPGDGIRVYKCNCTTCHKMGYLHTRLPNKNQDFLLLSPVPESGASLAGEGGLADYRTGSKKTAWYFCPACGVRCFAHYGEGEVAEVDMGEVLGGKAGGKMTKIWRPQDQVESKESYFSVNAVTLDAGQEGLSLKEWHENKWIGYVDSLDRTEEDRVGEPHRGGAY
ncbi:hypothetical protein K402DRAFT_394966 [Aulographum hederae CBS 113979]|uniref:CENP-V/GFA domain-containing protein n=1 Tax=Aulographum hederae CBS 113979 TaxID=1176131 RepID=A0A6G1GWY8_9PEZI|nr:hypothetical protein K402DRAFT_394966 [Aulographum hederae CBS 113979]